MPSVDLSHGFEARLPDPGDELRPQEALAQEILQAPLYEALLRRSAFEMVAACEDDRALRIVAHATESEALRKACVTRVGQLVAEGRDSNRWARLGALDRLEGRR